MLQASFANAIFPLIYNYAIKLLIDLFAAKSQITLHSAIYPVLLFIGVNACLEICWRIHNFAAWKSMPYIMQNVMNKVYNYVLNHSYRFFQNNLTGTITSKVKGINDGCQQIHNALEFQVSKPVLTTIVTGIGLACVNWKIFLLVIIFAIIQGSVSIFFGKKLNSIETAKENAWHKVVGYMADNISNIFTICSYAKKQHEEYKVNAQYEKNYKPLALKWHKIDFIMSCLQATIYVIFMALLFIYMIHLRNNGDISVGDIAFIMAMAYVFLDNTWVAINAIKDFSQTTARFISSFSIMQIPQEIIDIPHPIKLKVSGGEIIFKNLCFNYENNSAIFNNLNLHVKAGEKVGIVGHSGAGKSTFISLLLKNFKITSGDIIIDNQSICDVSSDSLRAQISLIPQDIMLFHRSIGENIGYAKENATQNEIEMSAKAANIHVFIESLPEKYDTLVGERGVKLSGGQRQRIAIARAILKNAPILILDEATSSLDSQTEYEIQKSINIMLEQNSATVIAIAHRLSTIKHLDRIIVMDGGQIIEDGSFQDLLTKNNGKFKIMWDSQVNGMVI
ncbi:MAG: ABC transporter ATP-binding protein/permease [Rickettsiales bacterium]|nr:ABC transporter ATP-binding protein/permease [Rickettsiales bacterium]